MTEKAPTDAELAERHDKAQALRARQWAANAKLRQATARPFATLQQVKRPILVEVADAYGMPMAANATRSELIAFIESI
jgi:hypothetical protein